MDLNQVRGMVITELLTDLPFVAKNDIEISKNKEVFERYLKNYKRLYTQPSSSFNISVSEWAQKSTDQSKVFDLAELKDEPHSPPKDNTLSSEHELAPKNVQNASTSTNKRKKDIMALVPLAKKTTSQKTKITSKPQTFTPKDIQNTSTSTNKRKKDIMSLGPLTKKTTTKKAKITLDPQTSTYPSSLATNKEAQYLKTKRNIEKPSKLLNDLALHLVASKDQVEENLGNVTQPIFGFNKLVFDMAAYLNDQLSKVVVLNMDLDEDPFPKGIKPSNETRDEALASSSQRRLEKADPDLRPRRISINLSSKEKKKVFKEIVPLERYIFESFKMIYDLKQTEFCFPDHTGTYPRINLLPGADPELFKRVYEMGFLGTVYPSFDLKELSLIPELFSDLKKFNKRSIFLKFFQISPEYYPGFGVFATYSFIEVGNVAESFSFDYETNQPWKKTPNVNREFVMTRRALGFKSISSIIKNYLKTFHVLKMKEEYSIVGKTKCMMESTKALEDLANKMVYHEIMASPETAQKLCRMLKHKDCTSVLAQLQNVIDESIFSPGDEYDPFGTHNASPISRPMKKNRFSLCVSGPRVPLCNLPFETPSM